MRVAVTGGTGFVGGAVLRRLLGRGDTVRALVRDPDRLVPELRSRPGLELHRGSLTRIDSLHGFVQEVDAVVHIAGLISARGPREYLSVNAGGTESLARLCQRASPQARWVQLSSLAATGPGDPVHDDDKEKPVSAYGRSKLAGEEALPRAGLASWVALRPPAVYGPGDRSLLPFFRLVDQGRAVVFPSGGPQRLSVIHVDDLADAIAAALDRPAVSGRAFHVAHPEVIALPDFLDAIGAAVGRPPQLRRVPATLAWGLAAVVEPWRRLTGRPRFLSWDKMREVTAPGWACDVQGIEAALGWRARIGLEEGLADTVRAYREAGWLDSE